MSEQYMYVVGGLDGAKDFEFARTEEDAQELATVYPGDGDVGIWKLHKVGSRQSILWRSPEGRPATNGHAGFKRHYRVWTKGEIETLRLLRNKGFSAKQIAAQMGRTETAVNNCASRHNI